VLQLRDHVDIFLTHDWPLLITQHGNRDRLFAKKPYFKAEVG
jgi:lariat debranching enzyme